MKYVIIDSVNLTQQMVDDCKQSSLDSVRKSNDESKSVLKYEGAQPASLSGETEYTHAEILAEMAKAEWSAGAP